MYRDTPFRAGIHPCPVGGDSSRLFWPKPRRPPRGTKGPWRAARPRPPTLPSGPWLDAGRSCTSLARGCRCLEGFRHVRVGREVLGQPRHDGLAVAVAAEALRLAAVVVVAEDTIHEALA